MNAEHKEQLTRGGIDVDSALERLMGSEALLEKFLNKFVQDGNYSALEAAVAAGDWEEALRASHTLKGMCGNLSMTVLYDLFTRQVNAIRAEDRAGAAALMEEISLAYRAVCGAVAGGEQA